MLNVIILQQNIDGIKVENDVDVVKEDNSIGVKSNEIYIPSGFSIKKAENKVRLIFGWFFYLNRVCLSLCFAI
jgi:hypothetical protein